MTIHTFFVTFVAAVAGNLFGSLWYAPFAFGKQWQALMGAPGQAFAEKGQRSLFAILFTNFLFDLCTAFVLGLALSAVGAFESWTLLVMVPAALWLSFMMPVLIGGFLWEGKPKKLILINAAHRLLSLVVMTFAMYGYIRILFN